MHLQEPPQGAPTLRLLHFKLGQQADKPLKTLLVSVDPEKVHLTRQIIEFGPYAVGGHLPFLDYS